MRALLVTAGAATVAFYAAGTAGVGIYSAYTPALVLEGALLVALALAAPLELLTAGKAHQRTLAWAFLLGAAPFGLQLMYPYPLFDAVTSGPGLWGLLLVMALVTVRRGGGPGAVLALALAPSALRYMLPLAMHTGLEVLAVLLLAAAVAGLRLRTPGRRRRDADSC
jgi:hypothetical protein